MTVKSADSQHSITPTLRWFSFSNRRRPGLAEQGTLSYSVSDMKKITSRKFQKSFGKLARALKPGQVLQVTEFGAPLVQVTRVGQSPVRMPDFAANLKNAGANRAVGERIMREFYDSLS